MLDRVPDRIRIMLDNWRFWMGIAYLALACLVIALFFINARTTSSAAHVARDEAIRVAQVKAAAASSYTACLKSIPALTGISRHLRGVNELAEVLLMNNKSVLAITPRSDPLWKVRRASVVRLTAARDKIAAAQSLPIPTPAQCRLQRDATLAQLSN